MLMRTWRNGKPQALLPHFTFWWECKMAQSPWKIVWEFLKNQT